MKATVTEYAAEHLIDSVTVQSWRCVRRVGILLTASAQSRLTRDGHGVEVALSTAGGPVAKVRLTPEDDRDRACLQGVMLYQQPDPERLDVFLIGDPGDKAEVDLAYSRWWHK